MTASDHTLYRLVWLYDMVGAIKELSKSLKEWSRQVEDEAHMDDNTLAKFRVTITQLALDNNLTVKGLVVKIASIKEEINDLVYDIFESMEFDDDGDFLTIGLKRLLQSHGYSPKPDVLLEGDVAYGAMHRLASDIEMTEYNPMGAQDCAILSRALNILEKITAMLAVIKQAVLHGIFEQYTVTLSNGFSDDRLRLVDQVEPPQAVRVVDYYVELVKTEMLKAGVAFTMVK